MAERLRFELRCRLRDHHASNVCHWASLASLLVCGGRHRDRTCVPLAGRRLSKPVHYHSANLPGCTLPVTSSGAAQSLRPVFTIDARGTSSRIVWLREVDLNHRHQAYEARALPTELSRQSSLCLPSRARTTRLPWYCVRGSNPSVQLERLVTSPEVERSGMVPPVRIERTTYRLQGGCSTG